jgi:hypothetical protein
VVFFVFVFFACLATFAFFVFLAAVLNPFFLRAGAARFAFDFFALAFFRFFAMIVLPIDPKNVQHENPIA